MVAQCMRGQQRERDSFADDFSVSLSPFFAGSNPHHSAILCRKPRPQTTTNRPYHTVRVSGVSPSQTHSVRSRPNVLAHLRGPPDQNPALTSLSRPRCPQNVLHAGLLSPDNSALPLIRRLSSPFDIR
ncbi:hypothetical protein SKAU_G00009380 [Synaphobranchus kaupii]|uniref:Uncharacterized protein n=1 Tax=Synaphobranchus kaupii TaxID=118154 RepID=A0A9Q1JCT2_SYNKA|nr:hypothetical protein SKAU_G00009380 [Synaphobranchus kaupii]